MRTWFAALLIVGAAAVVAPSRVEAVECGTVVGGDLSGDGTYGGGGSTASCDGSERGSPPGESGLIAHRVVRAEPGLCAGTPDALLEEITYFDAATGALIRTESQCLGAVVPGEPEPPPAPAGAEVVRRAPLPAPGVQLSPPGAGLVGFETWLWWGGDPSPPPVTVSVDGWSATVTPELRRIDWDLGNGDRVVGAGPGSEAAPSARYVYERQCGCTVTVELTWGGTVSMTHPLADAPVVEDVDGVTFTSSVAYDVIEREAVVVG